MASDHDAVRALLGREPQGAYRVVARNRAGQPVVIENSPLLDDGTPMPTRYWLIGADEQRAVGTLEGAGGVRRAEAEVDPRELADAHRRYADERDRAIPGDHDGPRPSGGVGGTRTGVKCLHAHYAWFLAGGDDPVGRWVERELQTFHVTLTPTELIAASPEATLRFAAGCQVLVADHFTADPPRPEDLTNTIGQISDLVDDIVQADPVVATRQAVFTGRHIAVLADVELGAPTDDRYEVRRDDLEELFRTLASEDRADRARNPGIPARTSPAELDELLATCATVVTIARRLQFSRVILDKSPR